MNECDYLIYNTKFNEKCKKLSIEKSNAFAERHNDYDTQLNYLHITGKITESERIEKYCRFVEELVDEMDQIKEAEPMSTDAEPKSTSVPRELLNSLPRELQIKCKDRETELNQLRNTGNISDTEAIKLLAEFITKTHKDYEAKKKGATPKQKSENPKADPKKKILPLNKEEKIIHRHLNNNKLNCTVCRKLITRLITEKTRYEGGREAAKHLKSCHGVKLDFAELKAPPTSDVELEWTSSYQNLSFLDSETSAQSVIGGNFPLLPPPAATPKEIYSLTPIEVDVQDSDNAEFVLPKNPLKRKASPLRENIQLQNKFQVFTDSETDTPTREINTENDENRSSRQAPPRKQRAERPQTRQLNPNLTKKKCKPPPPIIMKGFHGKTKHNQLVQQLKEILNKGYTLKYTKNNVVVQATDEEQYEQLKNNLKLDKTLEWHTYATEAEKTHAFVAKGLDHEPDTQDLIRELKEAHEIEVKRIYPMRTKFRILYLIITPASTTLKELKRIKYLNHVEVSWELRKKYTQVLQCKKCYMWGHSATFCNRIPKCPTCGETHSLEMEECQKPTKCPNCDGNHRATDLSCELYKFRVQKIQEKRDTDTNQRSKLFKEAPKPSENIWQIRKEKFKQIRKDAAGASTDSEISDGEEEAAAHPRTKRLTKRRQDQRNPTEDNLNLNSNPNVSDLIVISKEFQALGNSLNEAVRFLRDFLLIFKMTKQEDRALALFDIMTKINQYKF